MKIFCHYIVIVLIFTVIKVSAQETDSLANGGVTIRYINNSSVNEKKGREFANECNATIKEFKQKSRGKWWTAAHWSGIGIGYNGLISNLGHLSLPSDGKYLSQMTKSVTVVVNLVDFKITSWRNWSLVSGLGFEFNNFRFDRNLTFGSHWDHVQPDYSYIINGVALKKSKLVTAYLNVPLFIEHQFGEYNEGFINFGFIGGWRMQSHTKVKANMPGDNRIKEKNSQHLKNFHYGVSVSGGYNNMGLYVNYYPQSIFRSGEGPHIEQINIGVAILL